MTDHETQVARKRGQVRALKRVQLLLQRGAFATAQQVLRAVNAMLNREFDELDALTGAERGSARRDK